MTVTDVQNNHLSNHSSVFDLRACDEGASALIITHQGYHYLFDCWLSSQYHALHPSFYLGKRAKPAWIDQTTIPTLRGLFLTSRQNDHSDPITLRTIHNCDRHLPIWASPSLKAKLHKIGFTNLYRCQTGVSFQITPSLRGIRLKGYGGCSPFLMQDIPSKQTICIAPHSIQFSWLKNNLNHIYQQLELSQHQTLITTLCIGITPTILSPFGRLAWMMPKKGINIPFPDDTLNLLNLLEPETIIPIHQTPELRSGWATKHLVCFPYASAQQPCHTGIDIGTSSALRWLSQHYKKGVFVYPKQQPINC